MLGREWGPENLWVGWKRTSLGYVDQDDFIVLELFEAPSLADLAAESV